LLVRDDRRRYTTTYSSVTDADASCRQQAHQRNYL
jgi:hypothetical protein